MIKNTNKMKSSSNEIELIDFRIFEKKDDKIYEAIYGINVAKVQEIIKMPELFDIPAAPEYVIGIFDLRSTYIPLIDLAKWLGMNSDDSRDHNIVIITEFNNVKIGFKVHSAKRIRRISWKDIEPAHFNSSIEHKKITGTTRIEDEKTLLILDLESIIEELDLNTHAKDEVFIPQKLNGTVLFLDDSSSARKLIKKNLSRMGLKVIEAIDGEDGLQKLESVYNQFKDDIANHLKIIISDVEMPKMDGFHFLSQIHSDSRFHEIPVIFNSSICDKYSEEKAKELGAKAYLVKFDPEKFYDEIAKILQ